MFKKTFGNYDIVEGEAGDIYFVEDVEQSDWQERLKQIQADKKKKQEDELINKIKAKSTKKSVPISDEVEIKDEQIECPAAVFIASNEQDFTSEASLTPKKTSEAPLNPKKNKRKDPVVKKDPEESKIKSEPSETESEMEINGYASYSDEDDEPLVKKGRISLKKPTSVRKSPPAIKKSKNLARNVEKSPPASTKSRKPKNPSLKTEKSENSDEKSDKSDEKPLKNAKKRGRPRSSIEKLKIPKKIGRPRKIKFRRKRNLAVDDAAVNWKPLPAAFQVQKPRSFQGVPYCRFCEVQFETRLEKNEHICPYQSTEDSNKYICKTCGKTLNKRNFESHNHHVDENCPFCNRRILNPKRMIIHIECTHQGKPRPAEKNRNFLYFCDFCNLKSATKKRLLPHILTHLPPQIFTCSYCHMTFDNNYEEFEAHVKVHRIPFYDKIKCKFCSKIVEGKHNVAIHERNVHGHGKCEICSKMMTSKKEMVEHLKTHGPFTCQFCGKEMLTPSSLKTHETRHKVMSVEGFGHRSTNTCKVCGESFLDRSSLTYHMRYHMQLEELFCELCGKGFITKTLLKAHQRKIHEIGVKCEVCHEPMSSKEELKTHMATHGEFKCVVCNKNFVGPNKLKLHQRNHEKVDPSLRVACDFCPKTFDPKRLRSHVFRFHKEKYDLWSEGI